VLAALATAAVLVIGRAGTGARPAPAPPAGAAVQAGTQAAGATVRLEVRSEPGGATVEVGGQLVGTTPLTVTLTRSPAAQQVRVRAAGYAPRSYDFTPEADGMVFVQLRPTR
jgi:hypothetical protein